MEVNELVAKVNEVKAMIAKTPIISVDIPEEGEPRIHLYNGEEFLNSLPGEIEYKERPRRPKGFEVSKVIDGVRFFYLVDEVEFK